MGGAVSHSGCEQKGIMASPHCPAVRFLHLESRPLWMAPGGPRPSPSCGAPAPTPRSHGQPSVQMSWKRVAEKGPQPPSTEAGARGGKFARAETLPPPVWGPTQMEPPDPHQCGYDKCIAVTTTSRYAA